mmetsp:Transcript_136301/g.353374  ORF Transcript_136301/g.353374 Transcript_136301/m.353374 type:complete len:213 (+) Transcript_136301:1496-2134(+)
MPTLSERPPPVSCHTSRSLWRRRDRCPPPSMKRRAMARLSTTRPKFRPELWSTSRSATAWSPSWSREGRSHLCLRRRARRCSTAWMSASQKSMTRNSWPQPLAWPPRRWQLQLPPLLCQGLGTRSSLNQQSSTRRRSHGRRRRRSWERRMMGTKRKRARARERRTRWRRMRRRRRRIRNRMRWQMSARIRMPSRDWMNLALRTMMRREILPV